MRIDELEGKLYHYYKIAPKIERYEYALSKLQKERKVIEYKIKNKQWKSIIKSKSIEYGINVQTSKRGSSVENAVIGKEEELIFESKILKKNILKLKKEIFELKLEKKLIDSYLELLSGEFREILSNYYKSGREISRNKRMKALREFKELYE